MRLNHIKIPTDKRISKRIEEKQQTIKSALNRKAKNICSKQHKIKCGNASKSKDESECSVKSKKRKSLKNTSKTNKRCETIAVPEKCSIEDHLRNLLREERKKNLFLENDYSKLQKQHLETTTELKKSIIRIQEIENANHGLLDENMKYRVASATYSSKILSEHNYV